MTKLPVPCSGTTLIVGPSGVGKTTLTARALETWLEREGTERVSVLDFAPELERDGHVVGGRLERFTTVPGAVSVGTIPAHAPRLQGDTDEQAVALARENADRANRLFDAAPAEPRAVFVNDATIPYQHEAGDMSRLREYCSNAECVVVNAFEGEEFGADNQVSRRERVALGQLRRWSDRTVDLG